VAALCLGEQVVDCAGADLGAAGLVNQLPRAQSPMLVGPVRGVGGVVTVICGAAGSGSEG
jgi:hypothetical protein